MNPGQRTLVAPCAPREILRSGYGELLPGPNSIDATYAYDGGNTSRTDEIRAGMVMAKITTSGLWVPCKRTKASGAGTAATALIVDNAAAFKAGETLKIAAQTGCVISSINYTTNTITLAAAKTWVDDDIVYCDSIVGSEIPRAILGETIRLLDGAQYGSDWIDRDAILLRAGDLDVAGLLGDYAACRTYDRTLYLTGQHFDGFTFSDE